MDTKTKKLVTAGLFASLTCVSTILIKIPSPLKGYINLGDCLVLLTGWLLSPGYAFLSAALGSALADLFSGYLFYVPATFLIKGSMAIIAHAVSTSLWNQTKPWLCRLLSGFLAELTMVFGYYLFEGFLYGFVASLVNLPANCIQGIAGILLSLLLIKALEKNHLSF